MTKTFIIPKDTVEEIKKTYFVKIGYMNAIQMIGESKAPEDLMCKYGEACHAHQLIGEQTIAELIKTEGITEPVQSWECNFDDNSFIIKY